MYHLLKFDIKPLDIKLSMWHRNLRHFNSQIGRVVHGHQHLEGGRLVGYRTVQVSRVSTGAPLPVICLKPGLACPVLDGRRIDLIGSVELFRYHPCIVICDLLLARACDRVVMLHDSHHIHHLVLGVFCEGWEIDNDLLVDRVERKKFVRSV